MSNTQLEQELAGQPEATQDEIIRINTDARPRALQIALLIPILAALAGLLNSFRMVRLPDPVPSSAIKGMDWGSTTNAIHLCERRAARPSPRLRAGFLSRGAAPLAACLEMKGAN